MATVYEKGGRSNIDATTMKKSLFPGMLLVLMVATVPSTLCFAPHQYMSRQQTAIIRGRDVSMVRNIDLAEAVIFYGSKCLFELTEGGDDDSMVVLSGVESLVKECLRDDTAVLAILEKENAANHDKLVECLIPKGIQVFYSQQPPPNPRGLWEAIHSITIQPKGFGGSSGFGTKAADPERSPLPQHVVVLCDTENKCRAARFAGMRVLCLTAGDNPLADAIVNGWDEFTVDDIATPGSFWLNPPHPRDDQSNAVDPERVMLAYEKQQTTNPETIISTGEMLNSQDNIVVLDDARMSDDQLRAILADMDRL
jgi:hypothetical protein